MAGQKKHAFSSAFGRVLHGSLWTIILLVMCLPVHVSSSVADVRGGIEFTLANAALVNINNFQYLSLDIMVSSPDASQRLGTGIVLLNYSTDSFGSSVKANANVIVSKGELLTTSPFPMYNLYTQDHSPSRLAVTYEYTSSPGYGNLLGTAPQLLLNIKLKVLATGFYSGIDFQADLMADQQYLDNNSTLFNPVIASDTENTVLPSQPLDLIIARQGGNLILNWQPSVGCTYSVYSADAPDAQAWQLEVAGLAEPEWSVVNQASRRFFRVTASGLVGP